MRLPQLPTYYNYLVSITQQIAQQCKPNNFILGSLPRTNPMHILPEAYIQAYIRNCNWYTIYNPDIQSIPYTFKNRYTLLTCKPHQVGINRDGQPLTRTLLQLYGGQKKPPFGEKISQEIWVGTMAQTQSSWQPVLRGFTVKQNKFSN